MKNKILIYIVIFLILLPTMVFGEEVWLVNGKDRVGNEENIKAKEGFGVQLWLINAKDFFEKWNTSETPKMEVTKRAKRNIPISAVILFVNPGVNEKSECDVVYDMLIRKPDGGVYADLKELEVWQNKPAPPLNAIQLAVQNIGIRIEDKDPLGKYSVDVIVRDKVKRVAIPLHQEFVAEE